jgi:hypothetical protein
MPVALARNSEKVQIDADQTGRVEVTAVEGERQVIPDPDRRHPVDGEEPIDPPYLRTRLQPKHRGAVGRATDPGDRGVMQSRPVPGRGDPVAQRDDVADRDRHPIRRIVYDGADPRESPCPRLRADLAPPGRWPG